MKCGTKKKAAGGKLPMVEKGDKMVPAFAADGKGKMAKGGMTKMAKGGAYAKTYSGRSGDSAEFVTERGRSMSEGMKKMAEDKKKPVAKAKGGAMKSDMKKVASSAVKGHEARMHKKGGMTKMAKGGKMDGCAMRGKTKGSMR